MPDSELNYQNLKNCALTPSFVGHMNVLATMNGARYEVLITTASSSATRLFLKDRIITAHTRF